MQRQQLEKIVIIGTGGIATSFAAAFIKSKKYSVYAVGSDVEKTEEFCKKNKLINYKELEVKKDLIFLLAVPDSQIEFCARKYGKIAKLLVHFSGTTSLETLKINSLNAAVCWPLESFSKNKKINLTKVICAVDSSNEFASHLIIELIRSLNSKYVFLNNEERVKLHLTAVILNNFMYHLFTLIKEWTKNEKINSTLLKGLFKNTISSFYTDDKGENQTGPAKRKDEEIIQQHINLLKDYPELQSIYKLFTQSIMQKYIH